VVNVLPIIFTGACLQVLVRWFAGDQLPSLFYFVQPFATVALWVPATYVLMLPQFLSNDRDYERPI
jgi:rod shape-determining protein MreD